MYRMLIVAFLAMTQVACGYYSKSPEELISQARKDVGEYDYQSAEINLKNVLRDDADNIEARWLLANVYMDQWKLASAYKEYEKAAELGMAKDAVYPKLARSYFSAEEYRKLLALDTSGLSDEARGVVLAYKALAQGGRDEGAAAQYLKDAEAYAPDSPDVKLARLIISLRHKTRAEALSMLDAFATDDPYLESYLGRFYYNLNAFERAKAHYDAVVEAGKKYYNTYINLALIALSKSDREAAEGYLKDLRQVAPKHPAVDYIRGLMLFEDNDFQKAQSSFEKVVGKYSDFIPAYLYLGLTHYALGNVQQAEDYIERFVSNARSYLPLDKIRAHIFFQLGEYDKSIALLKRLREQHPEDTGVLMMLGENYLRTGNREQVQKVVEALIDKDPDNIVYRLNLGMLLLDAGDSDAGLAEIDKVVDEADEPSEIKKMVALKLIERGDLDKAKSLIDAVLKADPGNAEFKELKGMVSLSEGEREEAEKAFLDAVKENPDDGGTLTNLAVFYMRNDELGKAEQYYTKALKVAPDNIKANLGMARIMAHRGETAKAESFIEHATNVDGESVLTRVSAANIYNTLGEYEKAISLLSNLEQGKGRSDVNLALAKAYIEKADYAAADYALDRIPAGDHDKLTYLLLRARTANALGESEPALNYANKVLARDGSNYTALMIVAQVELLQGDLQSANAALDKLYEDYPDDATVKMFQGVMESVEGNEKGSIKYFEELYRQLKLPRVAILLSEKYLKIGEGAKAESILTQWQEDKGDNIEILQALGRLYIRTGQDAKAEAVYKHIIESEPDNIIALNNYAMLIADTRPEEALRYAEKAYISQRDNPNIRDTYNTLLKLNGKDPVD